MNNAKITKFLQFFKRNASVILASITLLTLLVSIITVLVSFNLHVTQIANAQTVLEQTEKANLAQQSDFVTQSQLKESIDAIKEVVTQTNHTVETNNVVLNQVLNQILRK